MYKILIIVFNIIIALIGVSKTWKDNKYIAWTLGFLLISVGIFMFKDYNREQQGDRNKELVHREERIQDSVRHSLEMSKLESIFEKKQDSLLSIIDNSNSLNKNTFNGGNVHLINGSHNQVEVNGNVYNNERRLSKNEKNDIKQQLLNLKKEYPDLKYFIINSEFNNKLKQDVKEFLLQNDYISAALDGNITMGDFQFKGFRIYFGKMMRIIQIDIGSLE
jgi:hypothetical protein